MSVHTVLLLQICGQDVGTAWQFDNGIIMPIGLDQEPSPYHVYSFAIITHSLTHPWVESGCALTLSTFEFLKQQFMRVS